MIEKTMIIKNKMGLHARPAALFVEVASRYCSNVWISKDGVEVDGKSIMGILMLAAESGHEVVLKADGKDEVDAIDELEDLLEGKFNEE